MRKWGFFKWTRDNQRAFADAVAAELDSKASKDTVDNLVAGSVSKTGDTMTGELTIRFPTAPVDPIFPLVLKGRYKSTEYTWKIGISTISTVFYIRYGNTNVIAITPVTGIIPQRTGLSLGADYGRWKNTYTQKINNGEDIAIPTKGGTMALVSDIEDILRQHGLIPAETTEQTEQQQGVENA